MPVTISSDRHEYLLERDFILSVLENGHPSQEFVTQMEKARASFREQDKSIIGLESDS